MTGGEHRAGSVEGAGREVDEVGGRQAEVDRVGAGEGRAVEEGGDERLRRRAHVVADDHLLSAREVRKALPIPARAPRRSHPGTRRECRKP